jgi:predicted RNA polymerase sigma factor
MATRRERLEEMLREDPNDPLLWYGLAMEQATAEPEAALATFAELRRRFADYVPAYQQTGQLLARLGREDEAKQVLRDGVAAAQKAGNAHARDEMLGLLDSLS